MGHPTLTTEQIRERDAGMLALATENPGLSNVAIGARYGLNRETVRCILMRERRRAARDERLRAKFPAPSR